MAPKNKRPPKPPKPPSQRQLRRDGDARELAALAARTASPEDLVALHPSLFSDLPLSRLLQDGLKKAGFTDLTDIQRSALPYGLCGRDVLGAAKTGSGKTLAFLIPVLERLHRERWTHFDGTGALVISPTRELAMQTFEVLRKVGRFFSFSAGLLIGGKDLDMERTRVNRMNILICTPGRLLQHMDQTPDFNCDNLQVLVLDEADRILDSGFEKCVNAIIENLPKQRQTLLFSATQTKSVRDLARLSLKDPEYIAVHEKSDYATPNSLTQRYVVVELNQKLDMLFSFIKTHLHQKVLVFLSSCKQLLKLQLSGLDFPAVDWVIQVDCPEDVATYIHRVGRTARYDADGNALLFLLPSEEKAMLKALADKKVPIAEIKVNPKKIRPIRQQMAFISYMRSVYLQGNKEIFNVDALPADDFADSLGLPGAPRIRFVKKASGKNSVRDRKHVDYPDPLGENEDGDDDVGVAGADDEDEDEGNDGSEDGDVDGRTQDSDSDGARPMPLTGESSDDDEVKSKKVVTRVDRMFNAKNRTVLSEHYQKLREEDPTAGGDAEDDDNLFGLVRADHDVTDIQETKPIDHRLETLDEFVAAEPIESRRARHLETESGEMRQRDAEDKEVSRARRRQLRREAKEREREREAREAGIEPVAELATSDAGSFAGGDEDDDGDDDDNERDGRTVGTSDGHDSDDSGDAAYDVDLDEDDGAAFMPASPPPPPPPPAPKGGKRRRRHDADNDDVEMDRRKQARKGARVELDVEGFDGEGTGAAEGEVDLEALARAVLARR
ncbi:ATPdependent RNA helicase, partial [Cladochytrium tenue]